MENGKYEDIMENAKTAARAEAVVLIVVNGTDGSGFSLQAESGLRELLPSVLRQVAENISDSKQTRVR
jgi:hypothetical protein